MCFFVRLSEMILFTFYTIRYDAIPISIHSVSILVPDFFLTAKPLHLCLSLSFLKILKMFAIVVVSSLERSMRNNNVLMMLAHSHPVYKKEIG